MPLTHHLWAAPKKPILNRVKINHLQMFLEAAVLKNSKKFSWKEPFYCSFLVNLQTVVRQLYLKKLQCRWLPMTFPKIILESVWKWLFLTSTFPYLIRKYASFLLMTTLQLSCFRISSNRKCSRQLFFKKVLNTSCLCFIARRERLERWMWKKEYLI